MNDERPRILVLDEGLDTAMSERLSPYRVERLADHPDPIAFARTAPDIRAIVTWGFRPVATELVEALAGLELIAVVASGYEGVDVAHAQARGVAVANTASVNSDDVSDLTVGLVLAAARGIVAGDAMVRDGRWGQERRPPPRPLAERKVGILGLGVLGKAIAHRIAAFGCPIAWWGRRPQPDAMWERRADLLDLARWSDILVIAARADAGNRRLVDRAVIDAVGPQGILVNIARGSIVDEDELIAALRDGRLGGAALDVFEEEPTPPARWADVPNTVLSPHTAGGTTATGPLMFGLTAENLRRHFAGEPLATPVPPPFH